MMTAFHVYVYLNYQMSSLFVHASVVSYVASMLSLFVPRLSFFWCLRRAVLRDHGIF